MSVDPGVWPRRMSPTDAVLWYMGKIADYRSTIGSLVILAHQPPADRLRAEMERLSALLPRMRQRVVEVPFALAPPEWVEDDQFDLDYHLRSLAVPKSAGIDDLLDELSPLYATPFDPDRPLWEAYVVDGLVDGRGAVFIKMHHCLTDGVGGSRMFEAVTGESAPGDLPAVRYVERRSTDPLAMLWRAGLHNAGEVAGGARAALARVAAGLRDPLAELEGMRGSVRALNGLLRELMPSDAASPVPRRRSLSRRLSTYDMPLAGIDAVRARLGATVNDVVLDIVCGAMHRWHTMRGNDVEELKALVPVSIRGAGDAHAGNRIALLSVPLPIGERDPLRRLRVIQTRMAEVKADRRATMYPLIARAMTMMPDFVTRRIGRQQAERTNFVCTNVPGPKRVRYLAGAEMERIYPYAPLVGDHPLAIALFSYRGTLFVGLDIDPLEMHDLPQFRDALRESHAEVLNVGRYAERPRRRALSRRRKTPIRAVR
jgi:diacylglycerol O-acyltransferase / wax synthase